MELVYREGIVRSQRQHTNIPQESVRVKKPTQDEGSGTVLPSVSLLFARISVDHTGRLTEAKPQFSARPLFADLGATECDQGYPQGNSSPCRHPKGNR